MKNFLTTFVLVLIMIGVNAQCNNFNKREFKLITFNTHINFGTAEYITSIVSDAYMPNEYDFVDLKRKSSRSIAVMPKIQFNITENVVIETGLGIEVNRYMYKEMPTNVDSYKFYTSYAQIPLYFTLQTSDTYWKVSIGGVISQNINNKVDYTGILPANKASQTENNMAKHKLELSARCSYRMIGVFANYGLTAMNTNPLYSNYLGEVNLTPFSVGISINL